MDWEDGPFPDLRILTTSDQTTVLPAVQKSKKGACRGQTTTGCQYSISSGFHSIPCSPAGAIEEEQEDNSYAGILDI